MNDERYVDLNRLAEKMNLKLLNPCVDISKKKVTVPDINRPALQLAGFFERFAAKRIQIIGYVEHIFISGLAPDKRQEMIKQFVAYEEIPCVVLCRDLEPDDEFLSLATETGLPVYSSSETTSQFMAEVIRWLNVELAPCISIHGVLVDVYGEGVLIVGESGIGKSEAALELVKRGHRLVSDDVVEIHKVSDETLVGTSPNLTRHFIELRGIGIVDVKTLYGVQSVRETQNIDLVITLEDWSREREYDRLGLDEEFTEYLGNKVVCHRIPIRPGRNLAIIVETAAINHRQKKMGYNAAQTLYDRVQESMMAEMGK